MDFEFWIGAMGTAAHESLLLACVGMVLFGIDDFLFDIFWMAKGLRGRWRRQQLGEPQNIPPKRFAIFIPLWRESAVIAPMVEHLLLQWQDDDYEVFLGCYPNDDATLITARTLAGQNGHVHCIVNARAGPTTKADNLNNLWHALFSEPEWQDRFDAIVLHDAEDKVHADELRLYSVYLNTHDMIQIPVVPLPDISSKWVAGHYADEFAEAHGKEMPLRHALDAPIPSAGVGTALSIALVREQAETRGVPFDPDSVTEDYELGWRAGLGGQRAIFVRAIGRDGSLIATRAYFPNSFSTSVRQKTRWVLGIALQGWDRLVSDVAAISEQSGAHTYPAMRIFCAHWMLWRDRRSVLSSTLLLVGYWGAILFCIVAMAKEMNPDLPAEVGSYSPNWQFLFGLTSVFIIWRLLMRAYFVWAQYGPGEAFLSIPRVFISNAVAIVASHRALFQYIKWTRGAPQQWDKTEHHFD